MATTPVTDNILNYSPKELDDTMGVVDATTGNWRPFHTKAEIFTKDFFPVLGKEYKVDDPAHPGAYEKWRLEGGLTEANLIRLPGLYDSTSTDSNESFIFVTLP